MTKAGLGEKVEELGSQVLCVDSDGRVLKFGTKQQQPKQTDNSRSWRYQV